MPEDRQRPRRSATRGGGRLDVARARELWPDVGRARELSRRAVRRARIQSLVLLPVLAGLYLVWQYREQLFGREWDLPVRILVVAGLIMVGWQFARDFGRGIGPVLFRRSTRARRARSASSCG